MLLLVFLISLSLPRISLAGTNEHDKLQKPLIDSSSGRHLENYSQWKLNFSSEAPYYFASVYGLLQQWPNTFFPNGHAITPGEIQPFTKLYHGRWENELPPSPEWLAFDIEMSYGIMGSTQDSHMLTYQTTRTVQVLYFDGESAALQGTGQFDSQMLHVFGNTTGPVLSNRTFGLFDEYARAIGLCNWLSEKKLGGIGWGFEGIVRMNAGFELIWCNFRSPSLTLISQLNVTAPQLGPSSSNANLADEPLVDERGNLALRAETSYFPLPPSPTRTDISTDPTNPAMPPGPHRDDWNREPFLRSQAWGWFRSATKHYGSSGLGPRLGEHRVKISSCGILNYYSPEFRDQALARATQERKLLNLTSQGWWRGLKEDEYSSRSEALKKLTRRRRYHRLDKVDPDDAAYMRSNTERVLSNIIKGNRRQCSGADWYMIMNEIVRVYAGDLMRLQLVLRTGENLPSANYTAVRDWMFLVRTQIHALLVPFLQYPADLKDESVWQPDSSLAKETILRCKYHHTRLLVPGEGVTLSPEEEHLRRATEETMDAICYVMKEVGFAVEKIWLKEFNEKTTAPGPVWEWGKEKQAEARKWTEEIEELMAWLGWAGEWVRCEKTCAWDEECYIPLWLLKLQMGRAAPKGKRPPRGPPDEGPPGDRFPDDKTPNGGPPRKSPPPGEPGFGGVEEDPDLWEPKCIKAEYTMR